METVEKMFSIFYAIKFSKSNKSSYIISEQVKVRRDDARLFSVIIHIYKFYVFPCGDCRDGTPHIS